MRMHIRRNIMLLAIEDNKKIVNAINKNTAIMAFLIMIMWAEYKILIDKIDKINRKMEK